MNIHFTGKPDAVIAPNNHQGLERETRVCFEFKTPQSVKKPCQRILEFIASCIFSLHPVMVVQTDLINNFYLLIGQNKTIYEYHSTICKYFKIQSLANHHLKRIIIFHIQQKKI